MYALERDLEASRGRGRLAVSGFWVRTLFGTLRHGLAERWGVSGGEPGRGGVARRAGALVDGIVREVRQAVRRLSRRPGFTATVVATLALGIGGTTALFSVIDRVVLRPLPYGDAGRLVLVSHESPTDRLGMTDGGYLEYVARSKTLSEMGLYIEMSSPVAGTGAPLEPGIIMASPSLLPLLRVSPVLGRGFTEEDTDPDADPVAIVTYGYWTRQLGADPDVLGKPVVPGSTRLVVGVLPRGFEFLRPEATVVFGNRFAGPDYFIPLERLDPSAARFGNFMYQSLARLAPGATTADAQRELESLMHDAAVDYPGGFTVTSLEEGGYHPVVERLSDALVGDVAHVLWILMGAVGFVLLIATANVANLFLVRAESRSRELAVRRALGASAPSIAAAFLSESLLLAGLGGALGLALARAGTVWLIRLIPGDVPRLDQVGLDARVLGFAFAVSLLTGLAFGVAPLVRARRTEPRPDPGDESRGGTAPVSRLRTRSALVVVQVAFALVLLVGSGLLLRTFVNLRDVDPGFDPAHVLTLRLSLSRSILAEAGHTEEHGDAARSAFMQDIVDRLAAVPGVERAAYSADLPLDGDEWHDYVATEGAFPRDLASAIKAARVFIGPGYLEAIGARLARGREFERVDFADQPRVAVVNESFAAERWPGRDPIGRRIAQYSPGVDPSADIWYTVVGVVRDVRETSLMQPAEPTVYLPTVFLPEGNFAMFVSNMVAVIRTAGDPAALLPSIRSAILGLRSDVPINDVETLRHLTARSFQDVTLAMTLLLIAASVSLVLGLIGVYGTVSYVVSRRTREFGLRIALGASARDLWSGVLRQGAVLGILGVGAGIAIALAGGRLLRSMLFGVTAGQPGIYAAVAVALLLVVLIASLIPALRAAAVDPVRAIRTE